MGYAILNLHDPKENTYYHNDNCGQWPMVTRNMLVIVKNNFKLLIIMPTKTELIGCG